MVDEARFTVRLAHGVGVDFQFFGFGQLEYLDQPHRVLAKPVLGRCGDLAPVNAVTLQLPCLLFPAREEAAARRSGFELLVDMGQEYPGQGADPFGLQEVELHEPLYRALARAFGEFHPFRDTPLQVEGQAVFGTARQHMHVAAYGKEEVLRPPETAIFGRGEQADLDQFRRRAHAMDELADPIERMQVAQPAFAIFHIGFDDISAVAHAFVARVAFSQLLGHEGAFIAPHHLGRVAARTLVVELLIAPDIPPFEEGCANGEVAFRQPDRFVQRTGRMAYFETQIPQHIEHRFDDLLAPRRFLAADEERDVDVGMRRHFRPTVSADSHDRQPLRLGTVGAGIEMGGRVIVDHADQLVDHECETARILMPGGRFLFQAALELGPAFVERSLEQFYDMRTGFVAVLPHQRVDFGSKGAPVDYRTLSGDTQGIQAARCSLAKFAFTVRLSTFWVPRRGNCSSLFQMTEGTLNAAICSRRNSCRSSTERSLPSWV